MDIFFHVGLGKTGSTYLQHKFFPKLKGIHYIHHTNYKKSIEIIGQKKHDRYFVSREFDRQFLTEIKKFSAVYPDTFPIMILRRHDSWIASQYRRFTKNGRGIYFKEFIDIDENKGRWDKKELNFYEKIEQLEHYFNQKPLVLLYDELRKDPITFFKKIASYTNTTFNPDAISLSPKHRSYSENQLLHVRRISRKMLKNIDEEKMDKKKWGRRMRKIVTHLIMYFHWILPSSKIKNEVLIASEDLQAIKIRYEEDWQKCLNYINQNAPKID
jgi:hypothetical protein